MMPYSRTARQSKHDLGSCTVEKMPNTSGVYGYRNVSSDKLNFSHTDLIRYAKDYAKDGKSFSDFLNGIEDAFALNTSDFCWFDGKRALFDFHTKELKARWPAV